MKTINNFYMDLYAQDTECILQGAPEIQGILNKEVTFCLRKFVENEFISYNTKTKTTWF